MAVRFAAPYVQPVSLVIIVRIFVWNVAKPAANVVPYVQNAVPAKTVQIFVRPVVFADCVLPSVKSVGKFV